MIQEIEEETIPEKEGKVMSLFQNVLDKERQEGKQAGIQQGMQQGIQTGIQQGMQQGVQQGMQQVVLNMLKKSADMAFISEVTGLSEAEINKLKNSS